MSDESNQYGGVNEFKEIPQQDDRVALHDSEAPSKYFAHAIPEKQQHRPYVPVREIEGAKNGPHKWHSEFYRTVEEK